MQTKAKTPAELFAIRLKKAIDECEKNQLVIAKEAGIHHVTLSKLLKGQMMPKGSTVTKLARALAKPPAWFEKEDEDGGDNGELPPPSGNSPETVLPRPPLSREANLSWQTLLVMARIRGEGFLDDVEKAMDLGDTQAARHLLAAYRKAKEEKFAGHDEPAFLKEYPSEKQ